MKTLTTVFALILLTAGLASAQDVTGFKAPASARSSNSAPNPHPVLTPQFGGVFVVGAKQGAVIISPTAPASYGIGEKFLAAPNARYDLDHECGRAAHRDTGGIKLLSFEF